MSDLAKRADIEALARISARLAGRDPDEHVHFELAKVIIHDGPLWRYPDFMERAETAYRMLEGTG